ASVDQLVAIARHLDSTMVSYWVGPTTTLVWIVDGEGHVGSASIRVSARRLASLIGQTSVEIVGASSPTTKLVAAGDMPQISRGDAMIAAGRTPTHVWRELHDLLVRPIQPFLPRARASLVTLVPHCPLFRLSFPALLGQRGRYLIERYAPHSGP